MNFNNIIFGTGTLYMKDLELPNALLTTEEFPSLSPTFVPKLSTDTEMSFEVEMPMINQQLLHDLIGTTKSTDLRCTLEYEYVEKVQKRRHKKKRINKKWAKRYGHNTIIKKYRVKDASIIPHDNGWDFVGGRREVVVNGVCRVR